MVASRCILRYVSLLNLWHTVLAAPYASVPLAPSGKGFRSAGLGKNSPRTVKFELDLTREDAYEVGTAKETILMNGQSPGPVLELDQGDNVEFLVHNNLPVAATVHFHGITQRETPWNDGVPGVSQIPIQPGQSYTYKWIADDYGTYFYHGHYHGQIADGLSGPIIVHPAAERARPFALISSSSTDQKQMEAALQQPNPIIVSDWFRLTYDELSSIANASRVEITCTDATIINGKGSVRCPGQDFINSFVNPVALPLLDGNRYTAKGCIPPLDSLQPFPKNLDALPPSIFDVCEPTVGETEIIKVDSKDGWASLNFISSSTVSAFNIAIDEHPMWIYEVDGHYINPQQVNQFTIGNGFRYAALVKLDKPIGDYTIRISTSGITQILSGYATLSYAGSTHSNNSTAIVNYGGSPASNSTSFTRFNEAGATPFEPTPPAQTPDQTFFFNLGHWDNTSSLFTLSGTASYDQSLEDTTVPPLIVYPDQPLGRDPNLTIRTKNGTWVDLIIRSLEPISPPHPIHKHANRFFVIGSGTGTFNYSSVAEAMQHEPATSFNLQNPPMRDGYSTLPTEGNPTWLALRYHVVQPGAFLLHCHIQIHMGGGMNFNILDGIDKWPDVPAEYLDGRWGIY